MRASRSNEFAQVARAASSTGGGFAVNSQKIVALFVTCCLGTLPSTLASVASGFDVLKDVEGEAMVELLQQGYLANREAFDAFSCTFVVKRGGANSIEDAIAGNLFNVAISNGLWIVDGLYQRYEIICADPKQEIPQPPSEESHDGQGVVFASVDCISTKILSDGALGLSYSPLSSSGNLSASFGPEPPILHTPLSMGMMGNNEMWGGPGLRQRRGFEIGRRYGGVRMIGDVACEVLVISGIGRVVREWSLDPDQGFLPLEGRRYFVSGDMQRPDERELRNLTIVTSVRKCPNGAYFPERSVTVSSPEAPGAKRVEIIELLKLDLNRPSPSALAFEIALGSVISEPPTMLANVRFEAAEQIHVTDLQRLVERCREARTFKLLERLPQEAPARTPGRLLLVAGSVTIILACLVWDAFRRRRRA